MTGFHEGGIVPRSPEAWVPASCVYPLAPVAGRHIEIHVAECDEAELLDRIRQAIAATGG